MLKNFFFFLALLAGVMTAHSQSLTGRSLGGPVARDVAYFNHTTTLVEGSTIQGSVAPLTSSIDGFGTTKMVTKLVGSPVGKPATILVPNPVERGVALDKALMWVSDEMPAFQAAVSRWLRSTGVSIAIYNYNQEIMLATPAGPKRMAIVFNATIDINGRPTYGAPKIVDPDPTFVEAVYTPLAPAAGLPTTWQYPDAGTLRWRLLNQRYEEISTWQTIQTGGAYDEPQGDGDPDAGLRCLVDARNPPGCTAPSETVRQIMDRTGASFGLLSYIRQLTPVYESDPTTGNDTAVSAISVDERTYNCGTYSNRGTYGFVLDLAADFYLLQPRSTSTYYSQVQSFSGKGISPVAEYSKSVPNSALGGRHPDMVIISPDPGSNELWSRSDSEKMKNVIYVSPVVDTSGGAGTISFSGPAGYLGSDGKTHRYHVGVYGDNYWGSGMHDQVATFNLPDKNALSSLRLTRAVYDDLILVNINGYNVFIGPQSRLTSPNTLYIEYQGTPEQYCSVVGSRTECVSLGAVAGPAMFNGLDGYTCPSGQLLFAGTCYYPGTPRSYGRCDVGGGSSDPCGGGCGLSVFDPNRLTQYVASSYMCYNSACGAGIAQYRTDAVGGVYGTGYGCIAPELATSWDESFDFDMTPYLFNGTNTIFIRTIVSGNGEGFIELKARSCAADLNLDTSAPPGPGAQAIRDALVPKAQ